MRGNSNKHPDSKKKDKALMLGFLLAGFSCFLAL